MTTLTSTEHEYEVRYPTSYEVDSFSDEGDAQEWAVRMARKGYALSIVHRTVEITKVFGDWKEIPAITPAMADAEMAQAAVSGATEYRVHDGLVSNISGYGYKITAVYISERKLRFAAVQDPGDESGWESFEDVASAFRHVPAGGVE